MPVTKADDSAVTSLQRNENSCDFALQENVTSENNNVYQLMTLEYHMMFIGQNTFKSNSCLALTDDMSRSWNSAGE